MPTFVDGSVASVADLNAAIGPMIQTGGVGLNPVPNVPTQMPVRFPQPFAGIPRVQVSPLDQVGGVVKGAAARQVTSTGFTLVIYQTTNALALLQWTAVLGPAPIEPGQVVSAGRLNQGSRSLLVRAGTVAITPTPNVLTPAAISFAGFTGGPPQVHTTAESVTPSNVRGTGVTGITRTGATIWLLRSSAATTNIAWIAVGSS